MPTDFQLRGKRTRKLSALVKTLIRVLTVSNYGVLGQVPLYHIIQEEGKYLVNKGMPVTRYYQALNAMEGLVGEIFSEKFATSVRQVFDVWEASVQQGREKNELLSMLEWKLGEYLFPVAGSAVESLLILCGEEQRIGEQYLKTADRVEEILQNSRVSSKPAIQKIGPFYLDNLKNYQLAYNLLPCAATLVRPHLEDFYSGLRVIYQYIMKTANLKKPYSIN